MKQVWAEIAQYAPEALLDARLKQVRLTADIPEIISEFDLDSGEAAALAYALNEKQVSPVLLFCDEQAARSACEALSIPVTGSLGLIIRAYRDKRVLFEEAVRTVSEHPRIGRLRVRARLINETVELLRRVKTEDEK